MEKQQEQAARFRALHESGVFVIPNVWDGASAAIMARLGFKALATSSAACAATLGKLDGEVTREEALLHAQLIVSVSECPVAADLENGFGHAPETVAETIRLAMAAGLAGGCGKNSDKLIPLLVPEHEIVPGEEQWHPAACDGCSAGCGTLVRIMEGVRHIERNGEQLRERIACIKKIEGNPLDPISGGRNLGPIAEPIQQTPRNMAHMLESAASGLDRIVKMTIVLGRRRLRRDEPGVARILPGRPAGPHRMRLAAQQRQRRRTP